MTLPFYLVFKNGNIANVPIQDHIMTRNIQLLVNDFLQEYTSLINNLTNERCRSNQTYSFYNCISQVSVGIGIGAICVGVISVLTSTFNLLFLVFPLLVLCLISNHIGVNTTSNIRNVYKDRAAAELLEKAFLRWALYNLGTDAPAILQEFTDIMVEIRDGDDVNYAPDFSDKSTPTADDLHRLIDTDYMSEK